jgi:hypothetical protein
MMRRLPIVISLGFLALACAAPYARADGNGELQAAGRIRILRLQVEENDARIAALEARLKALQRGIQAPTAAPAATPAAASGQISAWTSAAPAASAEVAPTRGSQNPGGTALQTATAPSDTWKAAMRRANTASRPSRPSRIARIRLSRGWNRDRIWAMLGPPEFVRGQRDGVQTWYYGSGWIRFQRGRVSGWDAGTRDRLSQASVP